MVTARPLFPLDGVRAVFIQGERMQMGGLMNASARSEDEEEEEAAQRV